MNAFSFCMPKIHLESSSIPEQQWLSTKKTIPYDYYEKHMIKHPFRSQFISRHHLLYAGLLEADSSITSYVPRPFKMRFKSTLYFPDFYIASGHKRYIIDLLKASDHQNDQTIADYTTRGSFFKAQGLHYKNKSLESILSEQTRAENWLDICQRLYLGRHIDTANEQKDILTLFETHLNLLVIDVIDSTNRETAYLRELALLRCIQKGILKIELDHNKWGAKSEVVYRC